MTARPHNLTPSRPLATGHRPLATRHACRGFTLTEVLIAMALVAVLLVGLGRIFQITSDTIKTGQAYQAALRKQKAVYTAISKDFLGYASDGNIGQSENASGVMPVSKQPAIIIGNYRVSTYVNAAAARAGNETPPGPVKSTPSNPAAGTDSQDVRSNNVRNGVGVFASSPVNFRIDTLVFFANGSFTRQTGSLPTTGTGTELTASLSSNEAMIWYGHLRLYNSMGGSDYAAYTKVGAGYGYPGMTSTVQENNPTATSGNAPIYTAGNTNNAYAEQFVLGRQAIVLREPTMSGSTSVVIGDDGRVQSALSRSWTGPTDNVTQVTDDAIGLLSGVTNITNNSPLVAWSRVNGPNGAGGVGTVAWDSSSNPVLGLYARCDVAATSAASFRERLIAVLRGQTSAGNAAYRRRSWWMGMYTPYMSWGASPWLAIRNDRPWANPYPQRPLTTETVAQRNNVLAEGCSQFVVEFAGDFYTQAANGATTIDGPDGVIDFNFVNGRRQTRWYGMPRDVDGNGSIPGRSGSSAPSAVNFVDVIPVRDWAVTTVDGRSDGMDPGGSAPAGGWPPRAFAFEQVVPPAAADYISLASAVGRYDTGYSYICAWGPEEFAAPGGISGVAVPTVRIGGGTVNGKAVPPVPQLIRVIVEMRDPAGALGTPVTQEYVFPVPQD